MSAAAIQFVGSLLAILVLAWIAKKLGLGGELRIESEDHARQLADEVLNGFDPQEIEVGSDGRSAIMRDGSGQVMIMRQHGNKFAGRLLGPGSGSAVEEDRLEVRTGDRRFGDLRMKLSDPGPWQERIAAIAGSRHA
ncbi:hypothetical protein [Altererythrobacter sp. MF3-039]|uniref:hypothetical protein n=1 Tax=Altererythrobacter sp. MF3-039 TaxID=3252901 RepID=UPI00390CCF77